MCRIQGKEMEKKCSENRGQMRENEGKRKEKKGKKEGKMRGK
jgi:hypothetical protein